MSPESLLGHFKVTASERWVVLKWSKQAEGPIHVAVLRSESGFADTAAEALDENADQTVVYVGTDDEAHDQDVACDLKFYYTCFARIEGGSWQKQHTDHVRIPGFHVRQRTPLGDSRYVKAMDRLRLGLFVRPRQ